jgi:glycosyltransferase involved in cell wall biosynthesis
VSQTDSAPPLQTALFIISHSHFGGAQELWANLVQAFRGRGWNAHLVALYPDKEGEQQTPPGISWNYSAAARPSTAIGMGRVLRGLVPLVRQHQPDVIFTALPAANVVVPLAVTLARSAAAVVTTHHTPCQTYDPKLNRLDGFTARADCVRHIVCVSDAVAASLDDKPAPYRAKLRTVRNAVPPEVEDFLEVLARRRADRKPGRTIVASGRLAKQKNYPVLVRAMQHLPDVMLEIIGAGPEEPALRALAEQLGVSRRIRFLGQKTREEALAIVADRDIFLQMSLFEGNSLSLIEAAKIGMPLIVSDVPEQREAITDASGRLCGILVPTHDDRALAKEIAGLLEHPGTLQHYARLAAELGRDIRFSKLIDAYEQLASKAHTSEKVQG